MFKVPVKMHERKKNTTNSEKGGGEGGRKERERNYDRVWGAGQISTLTNTKPRKQKERWVGTGKDSTPDKRLATLIWFSICSPVGDETGKSDEGKKNKGRKRNRGENGVFFQIWGKLNRRTQLIKCRGGWKKIERTLIRLLYKEGRKEGKHFENASPQWAKNIKRELYKGEQRGKKEGKRLSPRGNGPKKAVKRKDKEGKMHVRTREGGKKTEGQCGTKKKVKQANSTRYEKYN